MFSSSLLDDVAIIGAGLAGTALALTIHQVLSSIPLSATKTPRIRIYESRSPGSPEIASGVLLTPNGLNILDKIGVFDRIRHQCWKATHQTYKNDQDVTTKKVWVADEELHGYTNHRIWRSKLLGVMKQMLAELEGVDIQYGCRFDGVVDENDDTGVKFLINGQEQSASLLVGADGVYSSVRKHLCPDVVPEYTGVTAVLGHIERNTVTWPYEDYERSCTIQGKPGAIIFIPEVPDGSIIMVGIQAPVPDRSRAEWDALQKDKEQLYQFFTKNYDGWTDTARSIIDSIRNAKDMLFMWPFVRMPKLDRWYSKTARVVIVGDAAHAIPPSSAQGVNQALEDVWSLTRLITSSENANEALRFWQTTRQARIDAIFDWTVNRTNVERMPEADRLRLIAEGKFKPETNQGTAVSDKMLWLYRPRIDDDIDQWLAGVAQK